MRHRAAQLALAALFTLVACASGSRAASDPTGAFVSDPLGAAAGAAAAARTAIAAAAREFSTSYERGDVASMIALYTPDGVILPPGRHAIRGTAALTEYWTLAPGVRVLEHRTVADSVVVAGPLAYDWGTYHVRTTNADGAERTTYGKYVIVWRETAPGAWRMHVDMWNGAPAPAP